MGGLFLFFRLFGWGFGFKASAGNDEDDFAFGVVGGVMACQFQERAAAVFFMYFADFTGDAGGTVSAERFAHLLQGFGKAEGGFVKYQGAGFRRQFL